MYWLSFEDVVGHCTQHFFSQWIALAIGLAWISSTPQLVADEVEVDFARDVLPILSDNCFQCHGPDVKEGRKGDLRLDDESDAKRDRDGHRAMTEGQPEESELWQRITSSDADLRMPPAELGRTLNPQQLDSIKRWINQGAHWGRHWALERVQRPATDSANAEGVARSPIDQLVDRVLTQHGVVPNPRANRTTLIRRLSLDLTGLPPTPEQVQAFLSDNEPGAWDRLVDRTLASPAFGERMAWDWLEAARYADSNGYQGDNDRTMWPWRDWVVRAFNENLPYDQFTIWQLAGDLLPDATEEQILATGFNRNHMINGEGGRIAEENRVDYVMDMTETMSTVWLGLTLNCCRCHDHKFDPLKQREYYQLTAFFNQTPVDGGGGNAQTAPVLAVLSPEQKNKLQAAKADIERTDAAIKKRAAELLAHQTEWESAILAKGSASHWRILEPTTATALHQTLQIGTSGLVLASGANPPNDEYRLTYPLSSATSIGSIRLDAIRHPSMTNGGLARSDSGNFVLTDITFELHQPGSDTNQALSIASAVAKFEQGNLKVATAFDNDPKSGWAVWNGKSIDQDHAAVFRLAQPVTTEAGAELLVTLKFNSPHASHNLGHFRLSMSESGTASLDDNNDGLVATIRIPAAERSSEHTKLIRDALEAHDTQLTALRSEQSAAKERAKNIEAAMPKVMVMNDRAEWRPTFMLTRGLYNQPGEEVTAQVPASLPPLADPQNANRLDLARWLVSRDHPLTARVTVNRFWQMLFGIGLVKTSEDFGVQGEYPVQRELLDWLAAEFMESGWDVKHLLRTIVTSDTYQRGSMIASAADFERDPENRLLARGPRFRMPSWMLRDQALAVSGLLNPKLGGSPVYSYQPTGVWSEATFGKQSYQPSTGADLYRRSLYTFWRRIIGPPIFYDSARRQVCEVKPLRTNTPMHALTTLNDVTFVEAARALAEHALSHDMSDDNRMQWIAKRILGHPATADELIIWKRSLDRATRTFTDHPEDAVKFISIGDSKRNESLPAPTHAAWTALCLNLLNLDETLTKE